MNIWKFNRILHLIALPIPIQDWISSLLKDAEVWRFSIVASIQNLLMSVFSTCFVRQPHNYFPPGIHAVKYNVLANLRDLLVSFIKYSLNLLWEIKMFCFESTSNCNFKTLFPQMRYKDTSPMTFSRINNFVHFCVLHRVHSISHSILYLHSNALCLTCKIKI